MAGLPDISLEDTKAEVSMEDMREAMDEVLDNLDKYDSEKIRLQGEQYSFETVGKHFKAVYESVL